MTEAWQKGHITRCLSLAQANRLVDIGGGTGRFAQLLRDGASSARFFAHFSAHFWLTCCSLFCSIFGSLVGTDAGLTQDALCVDPSAGMLEEAAKIDGISTEVRIFTFSSRFPQHLSLISVFGAVSALVGWSLRSRRTKNTTVR